MEKGRRQAVGPKHACSAAWVLQLQALLPQSAQQELLQLSLRQLLLTVAWAAAAWAAWAWAVVWRAGEAEGAAVSAGEAAYKKEMKQPAM